MLPRFHHTLVTLAIFSQCCQIVLPCPYLAQLDQQSDSRLRSVSSGHQKRYLQQHHSHEDVNQPRRLFFGGLLQWLFNLIGQLLGFSNDNTGGDMAQVVENAKEDIRTLIFDGNHGTPKFVRLAFHDCVGGRCDGKFVDVPQYQEPHW